MPTKQAGAVVLAKGIPGMSVITIEIEPDEVLGLTALADLEHQAGPAAVAAGLLRDALAARLAERGLARVPARDAGNERDRPATWPARWRRERVRKWAVSALAVAVLVALWGGYVLGWQWTGFRANNQLWDWLHLLLLPVVVGTIPVWIQHSGEISKASRRASLALLTAFAVFVAAGYLIPLSWTGFRGNTLWDWFELLLLPAAVVSAPLLPRLARSLRPRHKRMITVVLLGWAATVVGGYVLRWSWTGYPGNTLWDWLQLLLLPLLVPTILVPATARWLSSHGTVTGPQARAGARSAPGRLGGHAEGLAGNRAEDRAEDWAEDWAEGRAGSRAASAAGRGGAS